jgi:hypothetical protein
MATQRQYLDPVIGIPRRHTPWFVWLMFGFALTVLMALIYAFASIASGRTSTLRVQSRDAATRAAAPASPSPAAPEANRSAEATTKKGYR